MELSLQRPGHWLYVRHVGADSITVVDRELRQSFLLCRDQAVENWPVRDVAALLPEHWDAVLALQPEVVLLGVDRLDYTKGIQQRIAALAELYRDGVLHAGRDVIVQIAVPSRESDPHYERERRLLEQSVSEVNGENGQVGRPVVHYLHQNMPFEELVALYLAADVMLVTPFRDGMNLVAKEYVACRADLTGRLVLSEFAGAATELRAAFLVNPHDLDGLKESITQALTTDEKSARRRMARLRRQVASRDVFQWADGFLTDLAGRSQDLDEVRDGVDDEIGPHGGPVHLVEGADA